MSLPEGAPGRRLAAALLLAVLALLWLGIVDPLMRRAAEEREAIIGERLLAERLRQAAAALPALRRQAAFVEQRPAERLLEGPSDAVAAARLGGLVQEIVTTAGATLRSIEPLPARPVEGHSRIAVRLALDGNLSSLVRSLEGLAAAPPLLLVDQLVMRRPTGAGLQSGLAAGGGAAEPVLAIGVDVIGFPAGLSAMPRLLPVLLALLLAAAGLAALVGAELGRIATRADPAGASSAGAGPAGAAAEAVATAGPAEAATAILARPLFNESRRPPSPPRPPPVAAVEEEEEPVPTPQHRLTGIVRSGGVAYAVLQEPGGRSTVLREGAAVDADFTLARIAQRSVWLDGPGGPHELNLPRFADLEPVATPQAGRPAQRRARALVDDVDDEYHPTSRPPIATRQGARAPAGPGQP